MNLKGIYSKNCWYENQLQEATVLFRNGIIEHVLTGAPDVFTDIHMADDDILMPGIIDAHVHINEPGRTDWEGFETATLAAAAGGITTVIDMPLNASPVTTTAKAFHQKLAASEGKLHVNVGFYGGLIPGNIDQLDELIQAGVVGIKAFLTHSGIDEFPNVGADELEKAAAIIRKYKIPLLAHCELTTDFPNELLIHPTSYRAYLHSRPKEWENNAVELMIALCKNQHVPVHIVHVSSAEALPLIYMAKKEGLPVTAETCPHYIYFNAEEIPDGATTYKCAPPIREKANNQQLIDALKSGLLDFIATDHSPAPPYLKEIESGNLMKAWGGISGLQFLLPASWTALQPVSTGHFIALLTARPAKFLGIDHRKGHIKEGHDADFTIWSPHASFTVSEDAVLHKHKISPYIGDTLNGVVRQTYVGGNLVFDRGKIIKKNKGQWLLRK